MKTASPPVLRKDRTLFNVAGADSNARVITQLTFLSKDESTFLATASMFFRLSLSITSLRNATRLFLPSTMMMLRSGRKILRGIAGNPAPAPRSIIGDGRSIIFATIIEST